MARITPTLAAALEVALVALPVKAGHLARVARAVLVGPVVQPVRAAQVGKAARAGKVGKAALVGPVALAGPVVLPRLSSLTTLVMVQVLAALALALAKERATGREAKAKRKRAATLATAPIIAVLPLHAKATPFNALSFANNGIPCASVINSSPPNSGPPSRAMRAFGMLTTWVMFSLRKTVISSMKVTALWQS